MSFRGQEAPPTETIDPCARCGKPSECAIWGNKVCYPCAGDWAEKADATPELGGSGDKSATYKAFTGAWLAEFKRGAA